MNLTGSSPRMWGTPFFTQPRACIIRFIPTHVGNTESTIIVIVIIAVHPHACGEHFTPHTTNHAHCGSSPRMWGTQLTINPKIAHLRFIPTHVGNTPRLRTCRDLDTVHPHACGEHTSNLPELLCWIGSSPRMWGTLCLFSA